MFYRFFSLEYFKNLLRPSSKDSIKSFSMFITVILGFILGLLLGISLLLDAKDGKIDTDLYACSVYVVSIGALVTLSSIPKIAIESKRIKYGQDIKMEEKTLNENSNQLPHLNEGAS